MKEIICQMDIIDSALDRLIMVLTVFCHLFSEPIHQPAGHYTNRQNSALAIKGCPKLISTRSGRRDVDFNSVQVVWPDYYVH